MNRHARRAHEARSKRSGRAGHAPGFRNYAEVELHFGSPVRAIAHHEAAHAMACAMLGLPFGDVTLLPRPELDRQRWLSERPLAPISNAIVSLAGPFSDWRMEQTEGLVTDPRGNEGDLAGARALGLCVIKPELAGPLFSGAGGAMLYAPTEEECARLRPWFAGAQALTGQLIEAAWPEVARAAAELLERRRLGPVRVREIAAAKWSLRSMPDESVLERAMGGVVALMREGNS